MWKFKVLIQFILSKIPFGEKLNYLLQKIYGSHNVNKSRARVPGLVEAMAHIDKFRPLMGAKAVHSYDHIPHLRFVEVQKLVSTIEGEILPISRISGIPMSLIERRLSRLKSYNSLGELLSAAKIFYCAPGDGADTKLKDSSVDIVISHAVLEHVPVAVVKALTLEAK